MSFETHYKVAPFLAEHKQQPYKDVYEIISYALYEELKKYEEQEALDVIENCDPLPTLYKSLRVAVRNSDITLIDVLSKAISRLNK